MVVRGYWGEAVNGWKDDAAYCKLFNETLDIIGLPNREAGIAVGHAKGYTLTKLAAYAANFNGLMAEVGTWLGGSARMICKTVPNKFLFCFDTFEGIPEVDESVESKEWLQEFKADNLDVIGIARRCLDGCKSGIIQGIFPQSLEQVKVADHPFCFVHADADVYPSTKAICEFFYPRLSPGGVIVFDDYGYKKATGTGQAILIKGTR